MKGYCQNHLHHYKSYSQVRCRFLPYTRALVVIGRGVEAECREEVQRGGQTTSLQGGLRRCRGSSSGALLSRPDLARTHNSSRLQHRYLSGGRNLSRSQHLFVSLYYCPIETVQDVLTAALPLTHNEALQGVIKAAQKIPLTQSDRPGKTSSPPAASGKIPIS